ncbi:hypothetical protein BC629DRAFT_1437161 [Irpex lacteus]|nr:hypothetical protein BC629DRAFT_1437161 [Irpex lacteus]
MPTDATKPAEKHVRRLSSPIEMYDDSQCFSASNVRFFQPTKHRVPTSLDFSVRPSETKSEYIGMIASSSNLAMPRPLGAMGLYFCVHRGWTKTMHAWPPVADREVTAPLRCSLQSHGVGVLDFLWPVASDNACLPSRLLHSSQTAASPPRSSDKQLVCPDLMVLGDKVSVTKRVQRAPDPGLASFWPTVVRILVLYRRDLLLDKGESGLVYIF